MSAHQPLVNGAYEHYYHHAKATLKTGPMFTGFFFKLWDNLASSVPPAGSPCLCSRCEAAAGRRSPEAWRKLDKVNYTPLLSLKFWLSGEDAAAPAAKRAD